MRNILLAATAAIIAASLAACDSQGPVEQAAAKRDAAAPAPPAKTAEDMRSPAAPAAAPTAAPGAALSADAELGDKVKRVLTSTPEIEVGAIDVAAAGGVVTLNGTVEFPAEKDRAALLALGVDGVRSVVNNLVVIRGS